MPFTARMRVHIINQSLPLEIHTPCIQTSVGYLFFSHEGTRELKVRMECLMEQKFEFRSVVWIGAVAAIPQAQTPAPEFDSGSE